MWCTASRSRFDAIENLADVTVPFCNCYHKSNRNADKGIFCRCGEYFPNDWEWESVSQDPSYSSYATFSDDGKEVMFHRAYSTGTAVIRGKTPLVLDQHYYWEIRILSELYGTDLMIGVGTETLNCDYALNHYTSFIGQHSDSYGLSYSGKIQHNGKMQYYGSRFDLGVIVGVHLDMWRGTLEFFINRQPMGIAYTDLKKHNVLYPMVCCTASQCMIRLITAMSFPNLLALDCMKTLLQNSANMDVVKKIPGLKSFYEKTFWVQSSTTNDDMDFLNSEDGDNFYKRLFRTVSQKEKSFFVEKAFFPRRLRTTALDPETFESCKKCEDDTQSNKIVDVCEQLYDIDNENRKENLDVLRQMHTSGANARNDELWFAALEPTSHHAEEESLPGKSSVITFSTRLNFNMCESCKLKLAIPINNQKTIQKCLQCFYSS